MTWILLIVLMILMWATTSLLYKAGVRKFEGGSKEEHLCLKFSVCVGLVFFVITLVYLIIRDEPLTILESAL